MLVDAFSKMFAVTQFVAGLLMCYCAAICLLGFLLGLPSLVAQQLFEDGIAQNITHFCGVLFTIFVCAHVECNKAVLMEVAWSICNSIIHTFGRIFIRTCAAQLLGNTGTCKVCQKVEIIFSLSDHQCTQADLCQNCWISALKYDIDAEVFPPKCPGCHELVLCEQFLSPVLDKEYMAKLTDAAKKDIEEQLRAAVHLRTLYPSVGSLDRLASKRSGIFKLRMPTVRPALSALSAVSSFVYQHQNFMQKSPGQPSQSTFER